MTRKGQVTIPKRLRDQFELKPGSEVEFAVGPHGNLTVLAKRLHTEREPKESRFAAIRGTLDLGMTTDEFMRFLRGDPDE
jgi:AbrB family looped-hinge helix DNA binding protein